MSAGAEAKFGVGRVTRFYLPLMLQAFSQSLTYPLVAGIVTHGPDGVDALTAFSQGQMVMFMIGAIGGGLVTTGLVFAKTWYGYLSFRRLNALMMGVLLAVQCVAALPPFAGWIFQGFFALPPTPPTRLSGSKNACTPTSRPFAASALTAAKRSMQRLCMSM